MLLLLFYVKTCRHFYHKHDELKFKIYINFLEFAHIYVLLKILQKYTFSADWGCITRRWHGTRTCDRIGPARHERVTVSIPHAMTQQGLVSHDNQAGPTRSRRLVVRHRCSHNLIVSLSLFNLSC